MKATLCILLVLATAAHVFAAAELFYDRFEDGDAQNWELENCTLAVNSHGEHYLYARSVYDTACHRARMTRGWTGSSGWVWFTAGVESSLNGMKGYPDVVFADGSALDTVQYGYGTMWYMVHRFSEPNWTITFEQRCFGSQTFETKLEGLRAYLLDDSELLDFHQHFDSCAVDSSLGYVTYHDVPVDSNTALVVYVRSERLSGTESLIVGSKGTQVFRDGIAPLPPTVHECAVLVFVDARVVDLQLEFYPTPIVFGPDELFVFNVDFSASSTTPPVARRATAAPRRPGDTSLRLYDIAGRRANGTSKGVCIQRLNGKTRRFILLR